MDLIVKTDLFDEAVTGGLYTTLLERARRVAALDISPIVALAARAKHPAMLTFGADVRDVPLQDQCADAVVSLSTLDHFDSVEHIPLALREIHRILRRDGMLIVTMDNPQNPILAIRNRIPFSVTHRAGLVPYPIGQTHSIRSMSRLIQESGFDVLDRTAIMHAPRLVAIQSLRFASDNKGRASQALGKTLMAFEMLEKLPTRYRTGHFIAIRAIKADI
ncbi:MAG TPA: methyltransferase domain-containing protein [Gemmatimonadaceae bacterium]|nr:methyltransferase domain-containing protein [Gemmatimonadaceae bacterium]